MDRKTQQLWEEQNLILYLIKENNRLSKPEYRFNWCGRDDGSVHLEIMRVVEHGWIIKYSKIFS
jgi:hypothetical protein